MPLAFIREDSLYTNKPDTIVQAVLLHKLDVDEVLQAIVEQTTEFGEYEDAGNITHYYHYCYHMAIYHKRAERQGKSLEYVLQAMRLRLAHLSRNDSHFKRCMALFESLREEATEE